MFLKYRFLITGSLLVLIKPPYAKQREWQGANILHMA